MFWYFLKSLHVFLQVFQSQFFPDSSEQAFSDDIYITEGLQLLLLKILFTTRPKLQLFDTCIACILVSVNKAEYFCHQLNFETP